MYEWVYINSSNSECTEFAPVSSRRASSCSPPLISASPEAGFMYTWVRSLTFFCSWWLQNIWERLLCVTRASLWKTTFLLCLLLSQFPQTGDPGGLGPSFFFPLSQSHVMCFKEVESIALFLSLGMVKLSFYHVIEAERRLRLCLHLLWRYSIASVYLLSIPAKKTTERPGTSSAQSSAWGQELSQVSSLEPLLWRPLHICR